MEPFVDAVILTAQAFGLILFVVVAAALVTSTMLLICVGMGVVLSEVRVKWRRWCRNHWRSHWLKIVDEDEIDTEFIDLLDFNKCDTINLKVARESTTLDEDD